MMNRPNSEITEVDHLSNQIIQLMIDDFDNLECDFILESLTELGYSPQLLNNDEGEWYITECSIYIDVDQTNTNYLNYSLINYSLKWSETIREAVQNYLNRLK